jgi:chorismate lyase/3-hydroxybenzoate synthase
VTSRNDYLQIVLADDISPPTDEHNLLVAFRFGVDPAVADHPAIADTYLDPVGQDCLYECWWIKDRVTYRTTQNTRIAECANYAILIQDHDEQSPDGIESLSRDAYLELMAAIDSTNHKHLAKAWNYLGGINDGDGDLERYRQFSVGRAAAFTESKIDDAVSPTGTGIGTRRNLGLTIIALASKHHLFLAENPRQLSAFHYPRQYGPSSPKFARGGCIINNEHRLFLLSGTAAIVGHESLHHYEVDAQLDETLRNLAALTEKVSVLDETSVLRVYLRDPDDFKLVADKIEAHLGLTRDRVAFLRGDICRRELVIEIDGVRVQSTPLR